MASESARWEFDYIIVGAGSAGCVLAARLSENPNVEVALIEAGGSDDALEIAMPVAFPQLFKTKFRLGFLERTRARPEAKADLLTSRQDARRQLCDQRDDLHPWQCGRL
jgi:choline dehydrogenase-like flavoprotein